MPRKKIYYGWWVVIASTIMSFVADGSLFFGFTVFFNPIRQTFGWSAAVMSFAFSIHRIGMGILSPVVGFLVASSFLEPVTMQWLLGIAGVGILFWTVVAHWGKGGPPCF